MTGHAYDREITALLVIDPYTTSFPRGGMGLIAHTCLESTVRFAAELGYGVTVIRDATADYSDEEMHAAQDINIPRYATSIVTANEIVDLISRST